MATPGARERGAMDETGAGTDRFKSIPHGLARLAPRAPLPYDAARAAAYP
jgi:hypothetical protein